MLRFKTAPFSISKQAGGHDSHAGRDNNAILVFCASSFIAPAVIGTESLAEELRLRTCVELIRNKRSYQSHPDASTLRMLSSTYSDAVDDCASPNGYSSLWTLMALATVTERRIVSVYPFVNGSSDAYATLANQEFTPLSHERHDGYLHVMWTRSSPNPGTNWVANHCVPLYPKATDTASAAAEHGDQKDELHVVAMECQNMAAASCQGSPVRVATCALPTSGLRHSTCTSPDLQSPGAPIAESSHLTMDSMLPVSYAYIALLEV